MSTASAVLVPQSGNDTDFRAWGKFIHDLLTAAGLTLSYSNFATGTSWTDVSHPTGTSNDIEVTEVWAFADTLQATAPVFVKIEYGGTSTSSNTPICFITVGTAHDGSGNLTGTQVSTQFTNCRAQSSSASSLNCYGSADTNRISICMFISASAQHFMFVVERTHDDNGDDNGDNIAVAVTGNSTSGKNEQVIPATSLLGAPTTVASTRLSAIMPPQFSTYGSDIGVGSWLPNKGKNLNPSRNLGFYNSTDFVTGATFTVNIYGIAHTFIALGNAVASGTPTSVASVYACMRYE